MEIRAKCKFDYESVKALAHASMYRRINPKFAFVTMMILCSIIFLLEIVYGILWGIDAVNISQIVLAVVLTGVTCFLYFGIPRIQYNALCKMRNVENEYIFYDETIKVSSKSEEYNGEGELKYCMIPKVMETSKYLFVFQSKNQVYLVDKSTITNGTIGDIREKLTQYVKKKYIICRY